MKLKTLFTLASVTTLGLIATTLVKKTVSPIYSAVKLWDDSIMYKVYPRPGKVKRTLSGFYFICNNGDSFKLFDKKYLKSTQTTGKNPSWVTTGLTELLKPRYFSNQISTKAMFAAKYVAVSYRLSARDKQDLNILGKAFFEIPTAFNFERQMILRTAVISLLMQI